MNNWLNKLERSIRRYTIPRLMQYLCIGMLGVFILDYLPGLGSASFFLMFIRERILRGEIWRLITFIFLPTSDNIVWFLLSLYFYYFLGTTLENHWGTAKFNLYYLIGILGNILAGFLTGYATNVYLNLSLLLSFAVLYPEMEFMIFFVLPVKAKWLGMIDGALLIALFLQADWGGKLSLVLSLLPFLLFFGKQAWLQGKMDLRHLKYWMETRRKK